jgi:predicted aldo/keto reductase-like oxidoreductase
MNDNGKETNGLTRRDFLRVGATGATGLAMAGWGTFNVSAAESAGALPKLPRRRYGRTGLEISTLVGASDWSADVLPLAVEAGVNYWHKGHNWTAETMPEALKRQPRESYYLEITVDRVGGDHKTGHIDEEQHYQFVKHAVQRSGAGYYDVFKFHFGYHSVEEAKTDLGVIRAYERLKKEGLVKHLAISQHHYKDIGGDMAYDIIAHLAEHSPYAAAQFFYTYGDQKEIQDVIALAKAKDFGVIAMKTMGGVGRAASDKKMQTLLAEPRYKGSTPATAMVKWLMGNPNLTAAVIATRNFNQLQENVRAACESTLGCNDRETLGLLAAYNKGLTCLLCSDCVSHCPEHIAIADILRYERYAMDYHDLDRARAEYKTLTKDGTACIACGDCLPACRADINIVAKLKQVHHLLG